MARYALQGKVRCEIWKSWLGRWCIVFVDDRKCAVGPMESFDTWAEALDYATTDPSWR